MFFRLANIAALAATVSMSAAPLAAADLPRIAGPAVAGAFDADSVTAQNHRRWGRRDRVDAGDVIGGLLVIGTIAAVASAASKASRNDRYRNRDYRYPDARYPDARYDYRNRSTDSRYGDSRGINSAVDMCSREVERNARIDTVDQAERRGDGWHVAGRLRTGEPFSCSIGNDGRIQGIDYGRGVAPLGAANDRQWDDDRYAAARQAQDAGAAPAYPGGPVDGDGYEFAKAPDGE